MGVEVGKVGRNNLHVPTLVVNSVNLDELTPGTDYLYSELPKYRLGWHANAIFEPITSEH